MFSRKISSKLDFRIKLLSGNNVVLIEANGYESEIFMPEVLNGRLSFQNIIPDRRCCYLAHNNSQAKENKKQRLNSGLPSSNSTVCMRRPLAPSNSRTWRMSAGQESRVSPLAFSTPNSAPISSAQCSAAITALRPKKSNKENTPNRFERCYSNNTTTHSPEPARGGVPTPFEVLKDTLVQIPNGIKVIRLYRDPTDGTPKNVGRVIGMSSEQADCSSAHKSVCSNSDFQLPDTPNLTLQPNSKSQKTPVRHQAHQKQVITPGSITRWRKCLTPRRTYSRRAIALLRRHSSGSSVKKRLSKSQSGYMANSTQGTQPTNKIEVRKRKLIVDTKKTISPASFKKQQTKSIDYTQDLEHLHQLPKTRKHFEMSKSSAFDILTNSNRAPNLSPKLSEQFRKGCVNKASSTYPKYKLLCSMPPLQHDEQMHELRRQNLEKKTIDIEAREKRKMSFLNNVTTAAMAEKATMQALQRSVGISIPPAVQFKQMEPRLERRATQHQDKYMF